MGVHGYSSSPADATSWGQAWVNLSKALHIVAATDLQQLIKIYVATILYHPNRLALFKTELQFFFQIAFVGKPRWVK